MSINIDVVTGFLEGGKTSFIRDFIKSDMAKEYTDLVLIVCEQGLEEYEAFENNFPNNLFVKYIENKSQLNDKLFSDLKKEYNPDYILVEYNGTWELSELLKLRKPMGYKIRNIMTVVDGSLFENYMFNMTKLMWDKISNSDSVIFNRFHKIPSAKKNEFRTAIKNINRNTKSILDDRPFENKIITDSMEPYLAAKRFDFIAVILCVFFLFLILKNIEISNFKEGYSALQNINTIFISILIQAVPFILLGTFVSSCIQLFVSDGFIVKLFSKNNVLSYPLAAFAGVFFPICDCGMVPICNGMLKKGVPLSKVMIFLLSAQAVNPVVIVSTLYAFSGQIKVVFFRIISGVVIAIVFGVLLEWSHVEAKDVEKHHSNMPGLSGGNMLDLQLSRRFSKIEAVFQQMSFEFLRVGKYVVVGAFVSAIIQVIVPKTLFTAMGNYKALQLVVMLLVSFIMSVCSTSNAFIAKSFSLNSSLNATLAFMVMGPMLDVKNLLMLTATFKKKFVVKMTLVLFVLSFIVFGLMGLII